MTALIYGDNPMRMIEKLASHHPISAEKKESHLCHSIRESSPAVLTHGIGITDKNLNTRTKSKVAMIFVRRSLIENKDEIVFENIKTDKKIISLNR